MSSPKHPSDRARTDPAPDEAPTTVYSAPEGSSIAPPVGTVIGDAYRLEARLGEGGIGSVYRGVSLKGERIVAIKFLHRDTLGEMDMRARFEREAMALSAMRHPNIVRFQDYGIANDRPYLVMDLIEGRTLLQLVAEQGALSVTRSIAICRQLLYALAYAHDRGLVHRDLKSANVMVQSLPHQPEHVTILDFGFVKLLPGHRVDGAAPLTRAGVAFGSPPYISPEQATGSDIDARADLYSVGVLLFEMLTGTRPFDGEITEVLRQHFSAPVPQLGARNPALSQRKDLQALIERAMAKSRLQRFASADAMLAALDTVDHKHDATRLALDLQTSSLRGLHLVARRIKQWTLSLMSWLSTLRSGPRS